MTKREIRNHLSLRAHLLEKTASLEEHHKAVSALERLLPVEREVIKKVLQYNGKIALLDELVHEDSWYCPRFGLRQDNVALACLSYGSRIDMTLRIEWL